MTLARPIAGSGIGVPALQVWIFGFVAVAGTAILAPYPPLRTAAVALYALPILAWTIVRVRGPVDGLDLAILGALVLHLGVSFLSADPTASLESSVAAVAIAGAFWAARTIGRTPVLRERVASAVAAALAAWVAVLAVTWVMEKVADVALFGWPPRLEAYQPYVWGSINTPPVLVLLAAPFVAFLSPGRLRGALAAVLLAGAVVVVPFSVGRAAWLGIGVAAAVWILLSPGRVQRRWTVAVLGAAGAAALAAVALVALRPDVVTQALDSRLRLWDQAARLFAHDPLTGSGPMTFAWARLQHVPDYVDRVAAGAAHNVAMQTIAEGGALLAIGMALVAVAWVVLVARSAARLTAPQRLAVAAIVGYAASTLLDDLSFLPAIPVLVAVLAAWSLPERAPERSGGLGFVLPATVALVVAAGLPSAASMTLMRFEASAGRAAALGDDWATARDRFSRAAQLQPASAIHWLSIGLAEHRLNRPDAARAAYERARRANPGDPRPWGALAALASPDERVSLLENAARRSNDPQYAWRLGALHLDADRRGPATEAFARATIYEPELVAVVAGDVPLTAADLDRAGATVGSLADVPPDVARWNVELLADRIDPAAAPAWAVARLADDGDGDGATAALAEALRAGPHDPRAHAAAGVVARLTCDVAARAVALDRLAALGAAGSGRIGQPVGERRIGIYGVQDLGDHQPIDHDALPTIPAWPDALIEVRDCGS